MDEALALYRRLYRRLYRPSERHPQAHATVCGWALAADTHEEATHHGLGRERWRVDRARGVIGLLQSPEVIAARGFAADEWPTVEAMRRKAFVGSGAQVADRLRALALELRLGEIVSNTWAFDPAARRHSHALLAREFGLAA